MIFKIAFVLFCLFAAHSTSSSKQDPSSTSSQGHQEAGLHRFRNCTVNKDSDSRTKPALLTTKQNQHRQQTFLQKTKELFSPTRSSLPVPAWQDEYLTAAHPLLSALTLSVILLSFFSLSLSFCLTMLSAVAELVDVVHSLQLFNPDATLSFIQPDSFNHYPCVFLFIFPPCTEVCIYDFILFQVLFFFCTLFDYDLFVLTCY